MQIGKIKLRDEYQTPAVESVINHIREGWRTNNSTPAYVNAYVAAGKSLMIGAVAAYASSKKKKTLILARQIELIEQIAGKLELMESLASLFLAGSKYRSTRFNTVLSTEGTCANALDNEFSEYVPDIILIDECHMINWRDVIEEGSSQYSKVINHFKRLNPNVSIVGFTGSPYRGIEGIKGDFWKEQLTDIGREYLVNNGFICPTVFGVPSTEYDYQEFNSFNREGTKDFTQSELDKMAEIAEDECITKEIVADFVEHTKDRFGTLVTCASYNHCLRVKNEIEGLGYTAGIITGKTPDKERAQLLKQCRTGEIKYMMQIGCLTTGVDVPHWSNSVILRRIGSLTLLVQLLGRGMRLPDDSCEDKHDHLVLDYSGTMDVMAELFNDPLLEDAQLEKSKRKEETIECPQCGQVNSRHAKRCKGVDLASDDGRCEFFFVEPLVCIKCETKNSPNARDCRKCGNELKDPTANLSNKHYTPNDYIKVKSMKLSKTKNDAILVSFILDPDKDKNQTIDKVNLFFNPFKSDGAKRVWQHNFVNRFVNDVNWKRKVLSMRTATDVVKMQAMFNVPTHITARKSGDYWNVHGVQFNSKRLMGGKEVGKLNLD